MLIMGGGGGGGVSSTHCARVVTIMLPKKVCVPKEAVYYYDVEGRQ